MPFLVTLAAFIQHKYNLAKAEYMRAHFDNDHVSVRRPRRAAAESLFESVQEGNENLIGADMLTTREMRNLLKQMKAKGTGIIKNKKMALLQEIKKRTSVANGAITPEEQRLTKAERHAKAQEELKEAENIIKLLGGQADDDTGSFELTKSQFVDAFENGQLVYHAGLPFDFVDHIVHLQMQQKALILASTLLMFVHLPISLRIFQYFHCRNIKGRNYLYADYSIRCFETGGSWESFAPLVVFVMVFFTIAYPLVMAAILIKHRHELQSARIRQRYGFLYDRFSRGAEFWEVVDVVRKLLLTCAVMWLPSSLGPSVALSISIIACCLLNYFRPHRNQVVFWVESASYLFAALSYVTSTILLQLHNETDGHSRFLIGSFLIGLDMALIFAAISGSVFTIRQVQAKARSQDVEERAFTRQNSDAQRVVPVSGNDTSAASEAVPSAHKQRFLEARVLLHRSRALQKCEIFATLTSVNSRTVLNKMELQKFERGDIICKQGEAADTFCVIVQGIVDVSVDHFFGVEGKEGTSVEVVNTLTRLDFFGESALLKNPEDAVRNATITCTSKTVEVCWLTKELVNSLLESGDLTDTVLETALATGEKRRESNMQAKRRSIIGEDFVGGGATRVGAAAGGAGDIGAGGDGDEDDIESFDKTGLFVSKAQTDADKAAKRNWS